MSNLLMITGTKAERVKFIHTLLDHHKLIEFCKSVAKGAGVKKNLSNAAYVMLDESLYDNLNVLENIRLCKSLVTKTSENEDVIMDILNLKQHAKIHYGKLEKNIQYRVRLAISLLQGYRIVVCEEPFLDNEDIFLSVERFFDKKGLTMIFSGEEIELYRNKYDVINVDKNK